MYRVGWGNLGYYPNEYPGVVVRFGRCGEFDEKWFPDFDSYRAAAKKIVGELDTKFIPFQKMFDEAIKDAQAEYWAVDGVHPTIAGACLMAQTWLKIVLGIKT